MTFRKFALLHLQIYCILVTLIFAASMIVGVIFFPKEPIRYDQLAGPFITAALCVLPTFVTYFKKEPTLLQYIIRHIIQFVLIEAVVLWMIKPPTDFNKILFYVMIGLIVLVIYLLVKLTIWLQKFQQAKNLTEQLKTMQTNEGSILTK
ncbi:MAG: hypothetical protein IJJ15_01010 [Ruminococcus sp.]|nr:hypothetical protein [Ruminococcus sp.]